MYIKKTQSSFAVKEKKTRKLLHERYTYFAASGHTHPPMHINKIGVASRPSVKLNNPVVSGMLEWNFVVTYHLLVGGGDERFGDVVRTVEPFHLGRGLRSGHFAQQLHEGSFDDVVFHAAQPDAGWLHCNQKKDLFACKFYTCKVG